MIAVNARRVTPTWPLWLLALVLASTVCAHAVERHGVEAVTAHQAVQNGGNRHQCRDGRTRYVARVGKLWAVEVWQGETMITSFLTPSQDYVNAMLWDCYGKNWWAHP